MGATLTEQHPQALSGGLMYETWDAAQCAAYLKCSVRKLRDLPVPRRYVGRTPVYDPDRVKAWVAEGGDTRPRRRRR